VQITVGKIRKCSTTLVLDYWSYQSRRSRFDVFWMLFAVKSELTSVTKIFVLDVLSGFKHGLLHVFSVGCYSPKHKLIIGWNLISFPRSSVLFSEYPFLGGESDVAILRFLCGSPYLCRLRTEGLVLVSKYWTYRSHAGDIGSVNLVACCR
jgi:hypothetical protein